MLCVTWRQPLLNFGVLTRITSKPGADNPLKHALLGRGSARLAKDYHGEVLS